MKGMKRIIFIDTIKQFEIFKIIDANSSNSIPTLIFALELELRLYLKKKNIKYKIPEQYVTEKQAVEMDKAAFNIAENWHKDLFKFRGISIGLLVQYSLKYYFARIIRNIQTTLNILEIEKPTEIYSFRDQNYLKCDFNNILKKICLSRGIALKFIPIETLTSEHYKLNHFHKNLILKYVKRLYYQIFFKYILGFLLNLIWFFKSSKKLKKNIRSKNILMIGFGYYTSLINEISKNNYRILLLSPRIPPFIKGNFVNALLRKKSGFYKFLDDYKDRKMRAQSVLFIKKSIDRWKNIIKSPDFKEIFIFNGISLWPFIKKKIYQIVFFEFKKKIELILEIFRILRKEKIDIITLYADVTEINIPFAKIASKLNIQTLVIQHGIIGHIIGYLPSYSDKFAAWGKISREILIQNGMPKEKIVITGCPRFDRYIYINQNKNLKSKIKKLVYEQFGIKKDKKLIVLTTSHENLNYRLTSADETPWDVEKMFVCVLNSVKKIPNSFLIIKLHPGDLNEAIPKQMINNLEIKNVTVIENYNIENLLIASDCVITTNSGTGLEAMIVEKPVIQLIFKKFSTLFSYSYDSVYKIFNCNDLRSTMQNVFNNPEKLKQNQKKFLKEYIYKLDGLSTKRVYNLIKDLKFLPPIR